MFRNWLIILLVSSLGWSMVTAAGAQDEPSTSHRQTTIGAAASNQPSRLGVVRLKRADAAALVRDLSGLLSRDVKIAADQRSNSVVIVAPADLEKAAENLIAQLDLPQTPRGALPPTAPPAERTAPPAEKAEAVSVQNVNVDLLAKALSEILATTGGKQTTGSVTIVRAPPATQKKLTELSSNFAPSAARATPQPSGQKSGGKVLYIPGVDAMSVAKALSGMSAGQPKVEGERPSVVVVMPSDTARREAAEANANPVPAAPAAPAPH
jgi:type II secretory pathway component GspD/PulD (secretin)